MANMKAAVALLAVVIVTSSMSVVWADEHNIPPITAEADKDSFRGMDMITISGTIKDIDSEFMGAITVQVLNPIGNRVSVTQVLPDSNGDYSFSITTGGTQWKESGDYTVRVAYLTTTTELIVSYVSDEPVCEEGTELVDGVCQIIPEPVPMCGEGTELVDGVCQIIPEPVVEEPVVIEPVCEEGTELVDGVCKIIEEPVVIPPPPEQETEPQPLTCGDGTELVDGSCVPISEPAQGSGSCLIATAAFGTEMAPQVQFLREVRDNTVMSTEVGSAFMGGFNTLYYAISPPIADMERQNPVFRELVQVGITPMLTTLSIMDLAEEGSDASVLGWGMLVIALNAMMYVGAPALVAYKAYGHVQRHNRLL